METTHITSDPSSGTRWTLNEDDDDDDDDDDDVFYISN